MNNQMRGTVLLSEGQPTTLPKVLSQFADVFRTDLGQCSLSVGIGLRPDGEFKVFPPRRPPIYLREKVDAELKRNVERGVFEPISSTVCAFPTVNVVKTSGAIRICGDFKPLNQFVMVGQHPLPLPGDLFSALAGLQS